MYGERLVLTRQMLPLALSWAITIHKSQVRGLRVSGGMPVRAQGRAYRAGPSARGRRHLEQPLIARHPATPPARGRTRRA
jgi:hypothetical protein